MLFVVLEFIKICRLFIGIILMLIQVHRHRKGFFWERGEEAYKVSYLGQWLPSSFEALSERSGDIERRAVQLREAVDVGRVKCVLCVSDVMEAVQRPL